MPPAEPPAPTLAPDQGARIRPVAGALAAVSVAVVVVAGPPFAHAAGTIAVISQTTYEGPNNVGPVVAGLAMVVVASGTQLAAAVVVAGLAWRVRHHAPDRALWRHGSAALLLVVLAVVATWDRRGPGPGLVAAVLAFAVIPTIAVAVRPATTSRSS